MDLTALVEVRGTFYRADGSPETGSLIVRPVVHGCLDLPNSGMVSISRIHADLDQQGYVTMKMVDSEDPAWLLDRPMPYKFSEEFSGSRKSYYVYVNGPGPLDIALLQRHSALDLDLPQETYPPYTLRRAV